MGLNALRKREEEEEEEEELLAGICFFFFSSPILKVIKVNIIFFRFPFFPES